MKRILLLAIALSVMPLSTAIAVLTQVFDAVVDPHRAVPGVVLTILDSGDYTFSLTLTPKSNVNAPTLGTAITVTVMPEPAAAGLVLSAIGAAPSVASDATSSES